MLPPSTWSEHPVAARSELSSSESLAAAGVASSVDAPVHAANPNHNISTQGHGMNRYSFEVSVEEYCNIDVEIAPYETLHVNAAFFYEDEYEYTWDAKNGLAEAFPLDNVGGALLVRYDYATSETHFEYEGCEWMDSKRKDCGWCEQSASWEGPGADSRLDCANRPELYRVSVMH